MLRNCLYCGVEFEPKKPKAKFCSDKHRVYYSRQQSKPVNFAEVKEAVQKGPEKKALPYASVNLSEGVTKSKVSAKVTVHKEKAVEFPLARYYDREIPLADRETLEKMLGSLEENPRVGPKEKQAFKVRIEFKLNRLK